MVITLPKHYHHHSHYHQYHDVIVVIVVLDGVYRYLSVVFRMKGVFKCAFSDGPLCG